MNNYCLYYIPKSSDPLNDVLTVYFGGNKKVTNRSEQNGVGILLCDLDVIGFLIYDFSKICRIKIAGTIFSPNNALIDLINSVLKNASLPTLDYKNDSGYVIGEVKEIENDDKTYIYSLDVGSDLIKVESTFVLEKYSKVVVCLNNNYILPARMIAPYEIKKGIVSGGRICSFQDLQINGPDMLMPVLVDADLVNGSDFFITEEKANA